MLNLVVACLLMVHLPQDTEVARALEARVDPRVELMSTIFRLAGNPEYNQPNSASPYSEAVEAHFRPFADDPVIETARSLRKRHGVSFDAVMSLAVHLKDVRTLELALPLEPRPPRLDERWKDDDLRDFLRQAREFVERTQYLSFFESHQSTFEKAAAGLSERLAERDYLAWFDGFFGERPGAEFFVIVGMLNGGANYGVSRRSVAGDEVLSPVIGAAQFDEEGVPVFESSIRDLIVHELCHSYTNPIVDRFAEQLDPLAARMYPHCRVVMEQQAYSNARTMLYESFVRAAEVRFLQDTEGAPAAWKEIEGQRQRGFDWMGDLANLYGRYATTREEHSGFEAFMPEVVSFFDGYSKEYDERMQRAPQVVQLVPANGAQDVDPDREVIEITFDRPMKDGAWALVRVGSGFPELAGELAYDESRQILRVPVKLEPEQTYRFSLNRSGYLAFRSEEGIPLAPVRVSFTTRAR